MAKKTNKKCPVKKGDLVSKYYSEEIAEVFVCVSADEELFVLGKAKFKAVPVDKNVDVDMKDHNTYDYEVCGCSWENLKAYKNDEETLNKNKMYVL